MSKYDRNPVRGSEPSTSGNTGRSGYRRSPEPEYRKGRQPDRPDNRRPVESDENEDMDTGTEDNSSGNREEQQKDKSRHARGRWKDAGEDQLRVERRQARQERMKRVMQLFEDSLLIDKVSLKERNNLMQDVRERLDVIKKEFAQRMKEQVTSHWTKLTQEGRQSRARDDHEEDEDPKNRSRPAKSGATHNREKNRYMSGEAAQRNRRDDVKDDRHVDERHSDDDNPRQADRRPANSGDVHNRAKNRVMSSDKGYKSKGDNSNDSGTGRGGSDKHGGPRNDRQHQRVSERGQASGDTHNRNRNRVRSGEARR